LRGGFPAFALTHERGGALSGQAPAHKAPFLPDDTPLPRGPHLLLDGEAPVDEAASGRAPQPGPSRPDGSYTPHRGRGLWGNEHGPVTPTPADEAFDAEVGDGDLLIPQQIPSPTPHKPQIFPEPESPPPPGFYVNPSLKPLPAGVRYQVMNGYLFTLDTGNSHVIAPDDVAQGALGDCYFIAAVQAIALHHPRLLKEMIVPGPKGTFKVRFFEWSGGSRMLPYWITVGPEVPVNQRSGQPAYARDPDPAELWPMLIEKAWASSHGGYPAVEGGYGGDAMEQLTGIPSQNYEPRNLTLGQLDEFVRKGYALTAGTKQAWKIVIPILHLRIGPGADPLFASGKLVSSHEYVVLGVDPEQGTIRLGNPWGWGEEVTLTLKEFRRGFSRVSVNPLK